MQSDEIASEHRRARSRRLQRATSLVAQFFAGQGAVQGLNIVVGLYLVRVLSVESYAEYGLATSFQQLIGLLMDLGFASTIIPLVGNRRDDIALVGRYVRAAKHLRDISFLLLAPIAAVIFLAIMHRHRWPWSVQIPLLISAVLAMYASGKMSYFSAPLILYGRLKALYAPQSAVGAARILLMVGLRVLAALNGWTASLIGSLALALNAKVLESQTRRYIEWPAKDNHETEREVLRYILPALPAMVFAAFQVQSSIFLISVFGQTSALAQVSALARLSQLFSILMIFNAVIVEPYMARQDMENVFSRYMLLLGLGSVGCVGIVLFTFLAPEVFLRVLGAKYEGLRGVVGWAMLAGALNYLQVLVWIMNRSRKWIYWRGTWLEIGLTVAVEMAFIVLHGVRTTQDAVLFSIVATGGPLLTHLYIMVYGLSQERTGRLVLPN